MYKDILSANIYKFECNLNDNLNSAWTHEKGFYIDESFER